MFFNYCFLKEMPFSLINNSEFKKLFYSFSNIFNKDIFPFSKINNTELFLINNNNLNKKFDLDVNIEPTVFSTQYISTDNLESKVNRCCNDNSLTFLHINIRSLSKNKSLLEELMCSCNIFPDIIGICETKLNKNSNIDLISLKNYSLHFVNSKTNSGGVLLYIKSSILYSIKQELTFTCSKYESLWVEISVGKNSNDSKNILVGILYRHPQTSISEFNKEFSHFFMENINNYKDICIFGDININSLNNKTKSVKNYLDQINGFGLKNLIKVPIRLNKTGGTLIDHFYCSSPEKVANSYVLLSDISDHFPLYVKLKNCNLTKNNLNNKDKYIQDFS